MKQCMELNFDVDEFINKGAPVKSRPPETPRYINLRIPSDLFEDLEVDRQLRVSQTRTSWILDAINDKLSPK